MKPIAKASLLVIGVLYTAAVTAMITNFVMKAKPTDPREVIQQLQEELTVIQHSAWQKDREHIRKKPITKEEAAQVFAQFFPLKGSIININFTLIVQCLNFGILLMVLYGFLWDPLLQFLDKRRAIIRDRLEDAARRKQEAEGVLRQHHQELAQLRKQRAEIIAGT